MDIFKKRTYKKVPKTLLKTGMRKKKELADRHERLRSLTFSLSEIGDLP